MTPDDIDAIVFSLAPTWFMGVADADRWAVDYIFGAGKPMMRVHTGGATGGSAVHAAYNLVRSGIYRSVLVVGAERIAETPDAQNVLNLIFDVFYEREHAAVDQHFCRPLGIQVPATIRPDAGGSGSRGGTCVG